MLQIDIVLHTLKEVSNARLGNACLTQIKSFEATIENESGTEIPNVFISHIVIIGYRQLPKSVVMSQSIGQMRKANRSNWSLRLSCLLAAYHQYTSLPRLRSRFPT
jgi:hypothetical protein